MRTPRLNGIRTHNVSGELIAYNVAVKPTTIRSRRPLKGIFMSKSTDRQYNDLQNTTQKTKIEEHEYEPHEMPVVNAAAKRVKYTYNLRIKSEMVYYRYKLPPWRIRFY